MNSLSIEHQCLGCSRIKTSRTYHPCLQGIMSHLCWMVAQCRVRAQVFCCRNATKIHFWGHKIGLESALMSSHCQSTKTISPAVEKLHCCITEVDSIQCLQTPCQLDQTDFHFELESLCLKVNTYSGG